MSNVTTPTFLQLASNPDLNQQLLAAHQEWWDARVNLDPVRMTEAVQTARRLRSLGAIDGEANLRMGQMNLRMIVAKINWWKAKMIGDERGMQVAITQAVDARIGGASIGIAHTKLDDYYEQRLTSLQQPPHRDQQYHAHP